MIRRKNAMNIRKPLLGLTFLALFSIIAVGWALVIKTDGEMRSNLLLQASVGAKALDASNIVRLSGSQADTKKPAYERIKEQLSSIRSASNQYRFLYLMGRKEDGSIFFYVDSEPETSNDHSPPGQVYTDATEDLRSVFTSNKEVVEGPVSDEWGTWVSALVPIVDPRTGNVIAVFGMDVAAHLWRLNVAVNVLPSIGFVVLLFSGLITWFYITLREYLTSS